MSLPKPFTAYSRMFRFAQICLRYTLVATLPSEQRGVSSAESYKTEMSLDVFDGKEVNDVLLTPIPTSTSQSSQVCTLASMPPSSSPLMPSCRRHSFPFGCCWYSWAVVGTYSMRVSLSCVRTKSKLEADRADAVAVFVSLYPTSHLS